MADRWLARWRMRCALSYWLGVGHPPADHIALWAFRNDVLGWYSDHSPEWRVVCEPAFAFAVVGKARPVAVPYLYPDDDEDDEN